MARKGGSGRMAREWRGLARLTYLPCPLEGAWMDAIRLRAEELLRAAKASEDLQDQAFAAILHATISARNRGECVDFLNDIAPYIRPVSISSTDPDIIAEAILDPRSERSESKE